MEPITSLLDAFIKLADRIINLEKTKLQNKQELFDQVVKPLFEELEPVSLTYMEIVRKAHQIIAKSVEDKRNGKVNYFDVDFKEIAWVIKRERDAIVMARIKVSEMARQIHDHIDDELIRCFADDIDKFFYGAEKRDVTTTSRIVLVFFNVGIDDYLTIEELNAYLSANLEFMERQWALIVKGFQAIKIYSLSSTKPFRKSNKL